MSPLGIERAERVFDQVDNSLTRAHEGLGLGLPLARSIVEAHGGSLTIWSTEGKGTVVTVRLPLAVQDRVAA